MPGFSFSPSLRNHNVVIMLKNGQKLAGLVTDISPAEMVIQTPDDNIIRVNRDDVSAYTGYDDKERNPVSPRLEVFRCYNIVMKCNGVKIISDKKQTMSKCELHNEHCEVHCGDYFSMSKSAQKKLLNNVTIDDFPKKTKEE